MKRLAHGQRQSLQILDQEIMLGAGTRDAHDIHFLKRVVSDEMSMYLPGDGYNGDGVGIGRGQTCHDIRGPGAGCHQTYPHLAGRTGIPVCSVGSALFVPHQYMPKSLIPVKVVINIQHSPTGIAENNIHTLSLQAFKQNARSCHLHVTLSSRQEEKSPAYVQIHGKP